MNRISPLGSENSANAFAPTFQLLVLAQGRKIPFETVDKFAAAHKTRWPMLFDSGQVMMSYLQLNPTGNMNVHFPHIFLIDGTGMIRNDIDGADPKALTVGALSIEIDRLSK